MILRLCFMIHVSMNIGASEQGTHDPQSHREIWMCVHQRMEEMSLCCYSESVLCCNCALKYLALTLEKLINEEYLSLL